MATTSTDLLSMGQQFSGLPMDSLIGGPLNAAATANGAMAMNQVRFMLDTCFQKQDENHQPIMINMTLTRQAIVPPTTQAALTSTATSPAQASIQEVKTNFALPLLTIIPLNSLAVKTVDVDFEMEVKSSYGEDHSKATSKDLSGQGSFEAKVGFGIFSASVKGSVSYSSSEKTSENSHYEKSNSAKYTVKVTAGQLPLPGGVKTIIDAYAGAIQPITLPAPGSEERSSQPITG